MSERILILGVGNTLLGDEGFGVHAMRYLEENYAWPENVRLVDGGTLGLLLLAELLECDRAIILDVALGDCEPGTFYELDGDNLTASLGTKQSMHQMNLSDTLISCELAGHRPRTLIFAMEPYDIRNVDASLTDQAQAKLPQFCEKVVARLAETGICAKRL